MIIGFQNMPDLKVGDVIDLAARCMNYRDSMGNFHKTGRMQLMRESNETECLAYLKSLPHSPDLETRFEADTTPTYYFEVSMD